MSLKTKISLMLGVGLFITLMVGANSYRSLQDLILTNQWVVNTYGILRQNSEVNAKLVALDSDIRGYLLSGKTYFLTEFGRDADDAYERLRELQTLTRYNTAQQQRLRELESLLRQKLSLSSQLSPDSAQQQITFRLTRELTERIQQILLTVEREENDLLGIRVQASELSAQHAIRDGLIGIVAAVFLILGAVYLLFESLGERTRLNVQLRENQQRLKQSLEAVTAAVAVVDASGKFYYVNHAAVNLLGEGILSGSYSEVVKAFDAYRYPSGAPYPPEEWPLTRALRGEASQADDVEVRLPDRSVLVSISGQPVFGEGGNLLYVVLTIVDTTERLRAQEHLRQNEQRLKQFLEAIPVATWVADAQGEFYFANHAAVAIFGDEVLGRGLEAVLGPAPVYRYPSGEPYPVEERPAYRAFQGQAHQADDLEVRFADRTAVFFNTAQPIFDEKRQLQYIISSSLDITQRVRAQEQVQENEQRLRKFLEAVPTAIIVTDEQGQFLYANQTAYRQMGSYLDAKRTSVPLPPLDAYRYPTGELYPVEERPLYRALRTKQHQEEIMEIRFGERVTLVGCTAQPVFDGNGNLHYVVMSLKDITEQTRAQERLHEAKELAENAARMKENFLANMSHEIRTPLNAITGFSALLENTPLNPDQAEYIHAVRTASKNLLSIVNDILDISKIEAGMLQLESVPFSIAGLVESIGIMLQPAVAEKNLKLSLFTDPTIPSVVLGDPTRLTQILLNLAGNAVKFTERGAVHVRIENIVQNEHRVRVRFSVRDTGIGIPPDVLPHVFERFRQESTFTTRRYGGSGLGLNIVKSLAEMQGGQVMVESSLGEGSCFVVEIEYALAHDVQPEALAPMLPGQSLPGSSVRVLVVEDNVMNQKLAVAVLNRLGYLSDVAENGQKALEKLRERPYDVVLMDIQMPIMDGYETTRLIRHELRSSVPIIAMTAHALAGERENTLQVGMNDFISKPFQMEELLRVIRKHLQATSGGNSEAETVGNQTEPSTSNAFRLDYLRDITADDPEAMAELLDAYLGQTPGQLDELRQALNHGDVPGIKRAAHTLKAPAKMLGLDQAAEWFSQAQELAAAEAPLDELRPVVQTALRAVERELPTIEEALKTMQAAI
jgi:PAS domain S-box-containing protein